MAYGMGKGDVIEKQIRNIRGASHFIVVMTPGCLDEIIQSSSDESTTHAKFMIAALQSGCNIVPVVAPGFKWPRPDTIHEDLAPICMMNGIKWKFGLQAQVIDRLDKFMTGVGSLQTLTNLSRASSLRSVRTNPTSDIYVPAPAGAPTPQPLSRSVSNASMMSMESRASQRSYASSKPRPPPKPASRNSSSIKSVTDLVTPLPPTRSLQSLVSSAAPSEEEDEDEEQEVTNTGGDDTKATAEMPLSRAESSTTIEDNYVISPEPVEAEEEDEDQPPQYDEAIQDELVNEEQVDVVDAVPVAADINDQVDTVSTTTPTPAEQVEVEEDKEEEAVPELPVVESIHESDEEVALSESTDEKTTVTTTGDELESVKVEVIFEKDMIEEEEEDKDDDIVVIEAKTPQGRG